MSDERMIPNAAHHGRWMERARTLENGTSKWKNTASTTIKTTPCCLYECDLGGVYTRVLYIAERPRRSFQLTHSQNSRDKKYNKIVCAIHIDTWEHTNRRSSISYCFLSLSLSHTHVHCVFGRHQLLLLLLQFSYETHTHMARAILIVAFIFQWDSFSTPDDGSVATAKWLRMRQILCLWCLREVLNLYLFFTVRLFYGPFDSVSGGTRWHCSAHTSPIYASTKQTTNSRKTSFRLPFRMQKNNVRQHNLFQIRIKWLPLSFTSY